MLPSTRQRLTTSLLRELLHPRLELGSEVTDKTLDRPGKSLTQSADSVTFDLLGELLEHVNLPLTALTLLESAHDLLSPLAALSARSALAATFVAVEVAETADGSDDIGALVHDNNGCGTETRLAVLETVKVHDLVVADVLGQDRSGGTTRDDGQEVVPSASDTTAVLVNELAERDGHLLFDGARVVDVTGDTEELGALVSLTAKPGEPASSAAADGRGDGDGLDVGDSGRASEETDGSRERGLETGLARLSLNGLNQRSLLAAHVGTGTSVDVNIEIVTGSAGVLANQAIGVGFVDGVLEDIGLQDEFTTDIDVGSGRVHGSAGNEAALDELVWVLSHDFSVLAGSGLALIGIDDQVSGLRVLVPVLEVHE